MERMLENSLFWLSWPVVLSLVCLYGCFVVLFFFLFNALDTSTLSKLSPSNSTAGPPPQLIQLPFSFCFSYFF